MQFIFKSSIFHGVKWYCDSQKSTVMQTISECHSYVLNLYILPNYNFGYVYISYETSMLNAAMYHYTLLECTIIIYSLHNMIIKIYLIEFGVHLLFMCVFPGRMVACVTDTRPSVIHRPIDSGKLHGHTLQHLLMT